MSIILFRYYTEDIRLKAKETNAKFIFIDEPQADRVRKAMVHLDIQVFVIGEADTGFLSFCKLLEEGEEQGKYKLMIIISCNLNSQHKQSLIYTDLYPNVVIDLNSPAWLTYSSGTTGIPKGIVHTNNSLSSFLILRYKK